MADSSANLPRERAKALSYCQPQRGGGVKVLLFPFSPEKGTKRGCPLAGAMARWDLIHPIPYPGKGQVE